MVDLCYDEEEKRKRRAEIVNKKKTNVKMSENIAQYYVRGTILNRTYGTHENLHISLFLLRKQYLVLFTLVPP